MISITGKQWMPPETDERTILTLTQKFGLSPILAQLLYNRGISLEEASHFLSPKIKDLLPEPYLLVDMEKAVVRIASAILNHEKITIYGDYDVDGATSVAQLVLYFQQIGVPVDFYIPDRLDEGYGVNSEAVEKIAAQKTKVLLMVDCGSTSIEAIDVAREKGMDCVILDHHTTGPSLPNAIAVVNAHRLDQPPHADLKDMCAAGIVFLFLVALQRHLKQQNFFTSSPPNLMAFCPLVALGTVCDVMPIRGVNRALVQRGLEGFWTNAPRGLNTLAEVSGVVGKILAYHFGFVLGPRINAGGRVGSSSLGVKLLTTHDACEAREIAQQLDQLNLERHALEQKALDEAIELIETHQWHQRPVIVVHHEDWHPGVVGIVASRLVERYQRPCLVAAREDALVKGSGRSVPGVDLGESVHWARAAGLLEKGGGHTMAVGFTALHTKMEEFAEFLCQRMYEPMQAYCASVHIDAELKLSGATESLLTELTCLEPYGVGNPSPRWCFRHITVEGARIVGANHIQCRLRDISGCSVQAIAFKSVGTPLEEALFSRRSVAVVGTLKKNEWRNTSSVQILIEDIAYEDPNAALG